MEGRKTSWRLKKPKVGIFKKKNTTKVVWQAIKNQLLDTSNRLFAIEITTILSSGAWFE